MYIRSDNGPEFTATAVRDWLARVNVGTLFIEPGSPWENGYIESFNGKFRDELLNGEIFYTLTEAKIRSKLGGVSCRSRDLIYSYPPGDRLSDHTLIIFSFTSSFAAAKAAAGVLPSHRFPECGRSRLYSSSRSSRSRRISSNAR